MVEINAGPYPAAIPLDTIHVRAAVVRL
jgi:hypothetical protein